MTMLLLGSGGGRCVFLWLVAGGVLFDLFLSLLLGLLLFLIQFFFALLVFIIHCWHWFLLLECNSMERVLKIETKTPKAFLLAATRSGGAFFMLNPVYRKSLWGQFQNALLQVTKFHESMCVIIARGVGVLSNGDFCTLITGSQLEDT